jgi:hypothetical protein
MAEITEQIIREAPQIEAYKLGLLESAKRLSEQPMQLPAYQAAPLSGLQQEAISLAEQGIGSYAPFMQAGQRAMEAGIGTVSTGVGAPTMAQLQGYTNPYQQMVTQQALDEMRRQFDISRQGAAAQAVQAGAFGGTREGVQRAEMERNLQDIMSQRIAQDYAQNYAQAQNLAGQEQSRALQAGQLFGQLGVQQAALGQTAQQMGLQDINTLSTLGQLQQQQAQAQLEAQRATQLQQTMSPYQQTAFLSDIYKGAPSSQISITGQTAPTTSPLLQAAGLGISGLAAASGAQKAFPGLFG